MHVEFVYILQSKYVRVLNVNLMMYIYVHSVKKGKFNLSSLVKDIKKRKKTRNMQAINKDKEDVDSERRKAKTVVIKSEISSGQEMIQRRRHPESVSSNRSKRSNGKHHRRHQSTSTSTHTATVEQITTEIKNQASTEVNYESSYQASYQSSTEIMNQASTEVSYQSSTEVSYKSSTEVSYQPSTDVIYQSSTEPELPMTSDESLTDESPLSISYVYIQLSQSQNTWSLVLPPLICLLCLIVLLVLVVLVLRSHYLLVTLLNSDIKPLTEEA